MESSQAVALKRYNSPGALASIVLMGLVGSTVPVITPSLISALVELRGIAQVSAAQVMSGEMLGMTLSTALIAPFVNRFDRRAIAAPALLLVAISAIGCMFATNSLTFLALRLLAGLGEGTLIALVAAALGGTLKPDRAFGIFLSANMLLSAALFRLVPIALDRGGLVGLFATLLVLALIGGGALTRFPAKNPVEANQTVPEATSVASSNFGSVLALASILLFNFAIGTVWPMMPAFASELGIATDRIAGALSNATIAGLVAALLAAALSSPNRRVIALGAGTAGSLISIGLLPTFGGPAFAVAAALFMAAWMFSTPFYLAILSIVDKQGRVVAFSMSLQFCGLAAGPLVGPAIYSAAGLSAVVAVSGVVLCLAAAAVVVADKMANKS